MNGINGKIFEEGITNSDLSAASGEFPFGLGDDFALGPRYLRPRRQGY
jgi:hypothetical protein